MWKIQHCIVCFNCIFSLVQSCGVGQKINFQFLTESFDSKTGFCKCVRLSFIVCVVFYSPNTCVDFNKVWFVDMFQQISRVFFLKCMGSCHTKSYGFPTIGSFISLKCSKTQTKGTRRHLSNKSCLSVIGKDPQIWRGARIIKKNRIFSKWALTISLKFQWNLMIKDPNQFLVTINLWFGFYLVLRIEEDKDYAISFTIYYFIINNNI